MNQYTSCPQCVSEYAQQQGMLIFEVNDSYQAKSVKYLNNAGDVVFTLPVKFKYDYRSQSNIHILFQCEATDHYFTKSFDGHKGNIYNDDNHAVRHLCEYLTEQELGSRSSCVVEYMVEKFFYAVYKPLPSMVNAKY